ncbi:MAG: phenylacetate--CoA ligase family protein, partial [Deltaproteobacteria bacterium]|nr:phenylacetate--CoA ligase family protein [Candidatus Tharpella sp.]
MYEKVVKHIIFPLHEKVVGRKTYEYLDELEKLQWAPAAELEELRFRKLQELLIHAGKNIPFYGKRFAEAGFNPERMQSIDDFKVLPLLSKADVQQNLEQLTWADCPGGLHRYNTGGSSGKPLVFYFDRRRQAYDAAARALTHRWWDIDVGDKELYLWGSPLEVTKQDKIKDLRDKLTNELLISAFEISSARVPEIVGQFRDFKPKCLFGYPSTIDLFCRMAAEQDFRLDDLGIQMVFSTAEVLYDHQRTAISKFFGGIPVTDCYGSREGGFISHECKAGNYHVMDPNYIIEYLQDGKAVSSGEDGEVVITHLDAWGMPFIRYRTGDVAQPLAGECSCGRSFSMMTNLRGRTTDFIVTPDGRW